METQTLYEFGKFRCEPREQLLLCDGKPVSLAPKAFEILVTLIRSSGRLLTKEELMQQVWPDSFVEEANLTVHISALRKALGETADGERYIETVPRRGYRFIAPVTEQAYGQPSISIGNFEAEKRRDVGTSPASFARYRWWGAALVVLLLAGVVVAVVAFRRPAKLTNKDTVVLADFTNTTGNPVFDGALRQGLTSQLEQSPFLNLLSDDRIASTLSLMAQPRDSRLNPQVAREVCVRTGSAAVLDGAIAEVGTQYLLTLKATNCSNGESLGSAAARAADENHVLDALGTAASEMRTKLGESLASVQKYDAPAESVTTPSLEALKAYSLGYRAMIVQSDFAGAIALFQRAISLDPNFAMAHARVGTCFLNLNETVQAAESVQRAYELREHASEREKLYIASHYELFVTGDLEAARKVYELSAQTYPRDAPLNNLGLIYSELGDFDKALAAYINVLHVSPGTGNRYANLISGYLQLNRLEEAKAAAREAEAQHIESPEIHLNLYWVDFLQHDVSGMQRETVGMMKNPGFEDQMLNHEADTALFSGHLAEARALTRRAIASAQGKGEKEAAALYQAEGAVREALVGNNELAKQQASIVTSKARDVEALSAITLATTGDSARANRIADDLGKRFPQDTLARFNYLPSIHAATWLAAGDGRKAIDALAAAVPYELGGNLETIKFVLYPVYQRGQAYLTTKQGEAAASEFQKILDHPGAVRSQPIGALAHLGLGRALVLSGDKARAQQEYRQFLDLWKDADTDIPILKQAKTEYAKLQ